MFHVLLQLLTLNDNKTHSLTRWMGLVSFLLGIGLQLYVVVWKGQTFDLQQFGAGIGLLFAGFGAALKLDEDKTPVTDPDTFKVVETVCKYKEKE